LKVEIVKKIAIEIVCCVECLFNIIRQKKKNKWEKNWNKKNEKGPKYTKNKQRK